jgi:hypothetical protein
LVWVRSGEPSPAANASSNLTDGHRWVRNVLDHPITPNRADGLAADGAVADITNQIGDSQLASATSHRIDPLLPRDGTSDISACIDIAVSLIRPSPSCAR